MDENLRVRRGEDGVLILDNPMTLRAIAHPARAHALDRLLEGDPLTATELAAELGITPSAMSYHLRELANWGIVERVTADGDARNRPWRACGSRLQVDPGTAGVSDDIALGWMGRYLQRLFDKVARLKSRSHADGPEGTIGYSVLYLTDEERARLTAVIEGALNDPSIYDRTPNSHPEGAQRYEAWTVILPDDPGE